ncbi:MAG: sulfite exporter TauE/SafE family protein [Allobranchiibius sp.]
MPADAGIFVLLLVAFAVVAGTLLQRVSGMGAGLVVSPTLVLLIGPVGGVLLTNLTTIVSAALIAVAVRRDIEWGRYLQVAPLIVVGSVPGALLVGAADRGWLEIGIGGLLLISITLTAFVRIPPVGGPVPASAAGAIGGFLNTTVGVAAPAMLLYAQATSWSQRSFAATLQPIFCTMGLISVAAKVSLGSTSTSGLPPPTVIATVVAMVPVGILIGGQLAERVSSAAARRVAVIVVTVGATITLMRGILSVAGA